MFFAAGRFYLLSTVYCVLKHESLPNAIRKADSKRMM